MTTRALPGDARGEEKTDVSAREVDRAGQLERSRGTLRSSKGGVTMIRNVFIVLAMAVVLGSGSTVATAADGCGEGRWRGPDGGCHPYYAAGNACPICYHLGPEGKRCWPRGYCPAGWHAGREGNQGVSRRRAHHCAGSHVRRCHCCLHQSRGKGGQARAGCAAAAGVARRPSDAGRDRRRAEAAGRSDPHPRYAAVVETITADPVAPVNTAAARHLCVLLVHDAPHLWPLLNEMTLVQRPNWSDVLCRLLERTKQP